MNLSDREKLKGRLAGQISFPSVVKEIDRAVRKARRRWESRPPKVVYDTRYVTRYIHVGDDGRGLP